MHRIEGYVSPPNSSDIFVCGFKWNDKKMEKGTTASIMKVDGQKGFIRFIKHIGDHENSGFKMTTNDTCRAAVYDSDKDELIFVL